MGRRRVRRTEGRGGGRSIGAPGPVVVRVGVVTLVVGVGAAEDGGLAGVPGGRRGRVRRPVARGQELRSPRWLRVSRRRASFAARLVGHLLSPLLAQDTAIMA